jgi:phosphonopyruvate decarboxylase
MNGTAFYRRLRQEGFDFFSGVPCSSLTPLFNAAISDPHSAYVGATQEGEAAGICAGAWLAGRQPVVLCQNSGLGNVVNPVTSLLHPCKIPALMVSSWRGMPGTRDEPQHEMMGQVTRRLLETIDLVHDVVGEDVRRALDVVARTAAYMRDTSKPAAIVVEPGSFDAEPLHDELPPPPERGASEDLCRGRDNMSRAVAIETVLAELEEHTPLISTTGKCSRELFTLADGPRNFYVVGAMGCANAVGLGVALNYAGLVVVLDGDGAALMKLGNLATIGTCRPSNLLHIVLDNGVHDSTGGQSTNGRGANYGDVAVQLGYRSGWRVSTDDDLRRVLRAARGQRGPHLVHVRIVRGSMEELGRPTVGPAEVARRFRQHLASIQASQDR